MSEKRALLVLDVQNDFCPGGALPTRTGNIVGERIGDLILSDHSYDQVLATQDWHIKPGRHFSTTPDYVDSWPPHCVAETFGAELHPAVELAFKQRPADAIFRKGQYTAVYSGFEGTSDGVLLADYLHEHQIENLDMVGIATDFVVRETALEGRRRGFNVRVITNLISPITEKYDSLALTEMRDAGIELIHLGQYD